MIAAAAGAVAAVLQLAGALKTAPPLAFLPFDLTLLAFAALVPLLGLLAATRRWSADPALALPLASAVLLILWLVVAGAWTASRHVAADKLPEVALVAPAMLAAGLLVGAEPAARRSLAATTLLIGIAVAASVGWGAGIGWPPRGTPDPQALKLQYQLAGLAMAMAAGLAAVRAMGARGAGRLGWPLLVAALALAALLPGGRTALIALVLGIALAPALARGGGAGLAWLAGVAALVLASALFLLLRPEAAEGLRTLERLGGEPGGLEARFGLWAAALDWAGRAGPLGLGTGGFGIAAGHGERRGLYPHNHALEALAEAGLPGLLLWLGAFGGAVVVALRLRRHRAPARVAVVAAMVVPVALTVLVSTDLGNRMAWFALGLLLSLGLRAAPARRGVPAHV
jgi:O-antigen ligase